MGSRPKVYMQYHRYDEYGKPSNLGGISTRNARIIETINWGVDQVLLMIGGQFSSSDLGNFSLNNIQLSSRRQRLYFIWEKFTPLGTNYTPGDESDFDYQVYGRSWEIYEPPILLKSRQFESFWHGHRRHGFLCLSDLGTPFPELSEKFPDLFPPPAPIEPVSVRQPIYQGLQFIQARLPRRQRGIPQEAEQLLRQFGYNAAADWVRQNPHAYLKFARNGCRLEE
jgi:hypothetical protein